MWTGTHSGSRSHVGAGVAQSAGGRGQPKDAAPQQCIPLSIHSIVQEISSLKKASVSRSYVFLCHLANGIAIQPPNDKMTTAEAPKLLWNPDNVRDVAESLGINLADEPLRILSQDTEYRLGQVTVEALRFMRAANRTTLTVQDMMQALRVLDVEPLYGYESTRPLRFGEASLGPGQPLFYLDDEEVDFEKLINAPLPKVPRDMSFTGEYLPHFSV